MIKDLQNKLGENHEQLNAQQGELEQTVNNVRKKVTEIEKARE